MSRSNADYIIFKSNVCYDAPITWDLLPARAHSFIQPWMGPLYIKVIKIPGGNTAEYVEYKVPVCRRGSETFILIIFSFCLYPQAKFVQFEYWIPYILYCDFYIESAVRVELQNLKVSVSRIRGFFTPPPPHLMEQANLTCYTERRKTARRCVILQEEEGGSPIRQQQEKRGSLFSIHERM